MLVWILNTLSRTAILNREVPNQDYSAPATPCRALPPALATASFIPMT